MPDHHDFLLNELLRLDMSGSGPPWPLQRYNVATHTWENIGIYGAQGPTGAQGATGETGPPGPIYWQGAWSNGHAYAVGDGVSNNGSSYVCIQAHTNHEPPNATYWNVLASKGDTGATGAIGPSGATMLVWTQTGLLVLDGEYNLVTTG
jgi:hypothetical protein